MRHGQNYFSFGKESLAPILLDASAPRMKLTFANALALTFCALADAERYFFPVFRIAGLLRVSNRHYRIARTTQPRRVVNSAVGSNVMRGKLEMPEADALFTTHYNIVVTKMSRKNILQSHSHNIFYCYTIVTPPQGA